MHEKEDELIDALCTYKNPDIEKVKRLLAYPLDFSYVLGRLVYSDVCELVWHNICTYGLQGQLNREVRNALKLLSEAKYN